MMIVIVSCSPSPNVSAAPRNIRSGCFCVATLHICESLVNALWFTITDDE